jgi:hypothetical protein
MTRIPVVWGERLYGRVDDVANQIHVATLFFHIWFCPIFPLQSFIVFEEGSTDDNFRGIAIKLNFKSIIAAYLRFIFGIAGLILIVLGVFTLFGKSVKTGPGSLVYFLLGFCSFVIAIFTYELFRASPERARKLAALAGIQPPPDLKKIARKKGKNAFFTPQQNSTLNKRVTDRDRFYTLTISAQEAQAGTQVTLELSHLPDKRKIKLAIPAGTPSQSKLRLPGLGAPGDANNPAGNLYVNIDIQET